MVKEPFDKETEVDNFALKKPYRQKNIKEQQFGRYKIVKELGIGGMGQVYQAQDIGLKRLVALKVISGEIEIEDIERFLREAKAIAKLDHPNIVKIYDLGNQEGQPFFTMELIEGGSLKEHIKKSKISAKHIAEIMFKIALAIHYAHGKGIIHRDLKPANVMLKNNKDPIVMDFGLAKLKEASKKLSETGNIIGTLKYMPPEQADNRGQKVDERSDVYSLGAILYEMLTTIPPFTGETMQILYKIFEHPPTPPTQIKKNIPKDLESICLKALEKDKKNRYQSAADFARDLSNFTAGKPIKANASKSFYRIYKKLYQYRLLLVAIVIVIANIVFIAQMQKKSEKSLLQQESDKGQLYLQQGKLNKALFHFLTLLENEPDNIAAQKELEKTFVLWAKSKSRQKVIEKLKEVQEFTLKNQLKKRLQKLVKKPKKAKTKKTEPKKILSNKKKESKKERILLPKLPQNPLQRWLILKQFLDKNPGVKEAEKQLQKIEIAQKNILLKCIAGKQSLPNPEQQKILQKMGLQNLLAKALDSHKVREQKKQLESQKKWQQELQSFLKKTFVTMLTKRKYLQCRQKLLEFRKKAKHAQRKKAIQKALEEIEELSSLFSLANKNTNTKAENVAKAISPKKRTGKVLFYLGMLFFYEKEQKWAKYFFEQSTNKKFLLAKNMLSKVSAKQIAIIAPVELTKKKEIKVDTFTREILFKGKISVLWPIDKVLLNKRNITWDPKTKIFSAKIQLKYGKNSIKLTVYSEQKVRTQKEWQITRIKSYNLPMFRGNLKRNGVYHTKGLTKLKGVKWKYSAKIKTKGGRLSSSPIIFKKRIYLGCTDGFFHAIDLATGKAIWKVNIGSKIYSSAAISPKTIFFGAHNFYALDIVTGKQKWHLTSTAEVSSSPIMQGNIVYYANIHGGLYAVDRKTGKQYWTFRVKNQIRSSVAIANDIVYFGLYDKYFYALNAKTGKEHWRFKAGKVTATSAIEKNTVYFGSDNKYFYALDAKTGKMRWRFLCRSAIVASAAVTKNMVYVAELYGGIFALTKNAKVQWKTHIRAAIYSSPTIAENVLYIGSINGILHAKNVKTGEDLWQFKTGGAIKSTPIVKDGIVYFTSEDGYLYALH